MKYKNITVIYNRFSQGGKVAHHIKEMKSKIEAKFKECNITYFSPDNIENMTKEVHDICTNQSSDLLICIGGDGTLSTVANSLMTIPLEKRIPILPIPAGSGNTFVYDFGITTIDNALEAFTENSLTYSDIIKATLDSNQTVYAINVLGMGFISDVAEYAVRTKKHIGGLAYLVAIFNGLGRFRPYKTKITFKDREEFNSNASYFLTVSNNIYTGAKLPIAPDAKINDGKADLIILHDLNIFQFLKGFLKIFSKKHIYEKGCTYIKSEQISITSEPAFTILLDGELLDSFNKIDIEVMPAQLPIALSYQ